MNFLSYWGFEDLYETVMGIYLQDKTPLHKSFVILRNFIRLNFVWVDFIPLERKFLRHIKPHLEKLFTEYGTPKRLQSDRAKKLTKEVKEVTWNEFFILLGLWGPLWNCDGNLLTGQNTTTQKFRHLEKLHPTKFCLEKVLPNSAF